MNIRFILYILGVLLFIEGGLLILPVIVALLYGEHDLLPILYSSAIAFSVGGLFWRLNKNCSKEISKREGFIIVGVVWIVYAFFGSLPFVISGYIPTFTNAFFETISGFTSTGATILTDIEALPHGLLFWRALMHFTGGIGILLLGIAVLPIFGVGSMTIYQAETSSVSIVEKLKPRFRDIARQIFKMYLSLNLLCILFYLPYMNLFDAVCHAFSTVATGGFSTKNASIGIYSAYIQYVTIIFMFLGSCSFVLYFYALKRDFKKIIKNDEFRFYLIMTLVASLYVCIGLLINNYPAGQTFREGLFNVVSVMTTTGYANSNYMQWSPPLWVIFFLLSFIGGCAGSTSSGLKMVRLLLLLKMIPIQFKKIMHPNAIIQVKLNGQKVSGERLARTLAFFMIFLCIYVVGVVVLMICGLNFTTAISASIACLSNTGPGLDMIGPASNYAGLSQAGKWICSFLMLLGRLEIYSILILFSSSFWRKQ